MHCCYTGHPYWDVKVTAVAPKIPLTSIHVTLVRGFLGATGLSHLGPNVNTFRTAITFRTSTDVCVNRLPLASRTKDHWSGTSTSSQRQENFFSITSFAFDERKYIYIWIFRWRLMFFAGGFEVWYHTDSRNSFKERGTNKRALGGCQQVLN